MIESDGHSKLKSKAFFVCFVVHIPYHWRIFTVYWHRRHRHNIQRSFIVYVHRWEHEDTQTCWWWCWQFRHNWLPFLIALINDAHLYTYIYIVWHMPWYLHIHRLMTVHIPLKMAQISTFVIQDTNKCSIPGMLSASCKHDQHNNTISIHTYTHQQIIIGKWSVTNQCYEIFVCTFV